MLLDLLAQEIGQLFIERAELQLTIESQRTQIENLENALLNLSQTLTVNLDD